MTLLELLGSQETIDEIKKAAEEVLGSAISSAFGNLELSEAQILGPLKAAARDIVFDALKQADTWVDKQIVKVKNLSLK